MIVTLDNILKSITGVLNEQYPDVPVQRNPEQQEADKPCFCVMFTLGEMQNRMGKDFLRKTGISLMYLPGKDLPDAYDRMYGIADFLDRALEFIPYKEGTGAEKIRTVERKWEINTGQLHYLLSINVAISNQENTPDIEVMEGYRGGVGNVKNKGRNREI